MLEGSSSSAPSRVSVLDIEDVVGRTGKRMRAAEIEELDESPPRDLLERENPDNASESPDKLAPLVDNSTKESEIAVDGSQSLHEEYFTGSRDALGRPLTGEFFHDERFIHWLRDKKAQWRIRREEMKKRRLENEEAGSRTRRSDGSLNSFFLRSRIDLKSRPIQIISVDSTHQVSLNWLKKYLSMLLICLYTC